LIAIKAEGEVLAEERNLTAAAARGDPDGAGVVLCRLPFEEALEKEAAYNLVLRRSHGGWRVLCGGWRGVGGGVLSF
jgi:hypothetical protein